ncbi:hypothetical protein LTR04_006163 [Oleoguttula sp. CCFEE 6159]|nr:hypothetical protein LTR04_006163 [Oleoguttula sp. CCFEE 6159]
MEVTSDFKAFQEAISTSLVATTRTTNDISSEDLGFHRSLDPSVAASLDRQNARLLSLAQRLLNNAASNSEVVGPSLSDADAVEGNWRGVVDVVDSLLEKADISLDEYTGVVKRLSPSQEQVLATAPKARPSRIAKAIRSQDLPKPQLLFDNVPTNSETDAFKPLLLYQHPYQTEIEQYKYPPSVYAVADPIPYHPFESTKATFVDTPEALASMLAELKTAKEIAVDLEHHDQRSYIGLVSLMQISTRNHDWVVDTLKPWRRKLECLNEVFANPDILKVLHGAYMDIMWLQRDLGLYVVGLFDTHYAARALGLGGSLAFLLKKYVDFDAQKQYQTADWRIRPLPAEMFDYARSDTHFLLYVYDNLRNELIQKSNFEDPEKDKIQHVLERSKETALQRYESPVYDEQRGVGPGGWYNLLHRTPAIFSREQFAVFRAVHQWRDKVAREQDDGVHYIMPNHIIFSISKAMPADKVALFSIAQPTSQTVRLRADELLSVIAKAKASGENGPNMMDIINEVNPIRSVSPAPVVRPLTNVSPTVNGTVPNKSGVVDALAARSFTSAFWGGALDRDTSQQRRTMTTDSIRLALPLPQLTAEIFADRNSAAAVTRTSISVDPGARAEHEYIKNRTPAAEAEDGIFVIKQLGGARKRKNDEIASEQAKTDTAATDSMAEQEDKVTIPDEEAQRAMEKAQRKAERKAAKKLKKQHQASAGAADSSQLNDSSMYDDDNDGMDVDVDAQPFDYASAPSVLHPPRDPADRKGKGAAKSKPFNPYAKAMDAPKGLGRVQKERAGKSHTFKK